MNQTVKRRIYYVSVIIALVTILVCAVIINRTLVNTPEFNIEEISAEAGEPVSAYMAYVSDDGEIVVGIAQAGDESLAEVINYVQNVPHGDILDEKVPGSRTPDAWAVLYDDENRIASRVNFYDGGMTVWYDGERYRAERETMEQLIELCDANAVEEEESPSPTPSETPDGEQAPAVEEENDKN